MKICQRSDCSNPVTGKNHSIDRKYEIECDKCIERATKRGWYLLSIQMKKQFSTSPFYKAFVKEHANAIEEGRRIYYDLPERQRRKSIESSR